MPLSFQLQIPTTFFFFPSSYGVLPVWVRDFERSGFPSETSDDDILTASVIRNRRLPSPSLLPRDSNRPNSETLVRCWCRAPNNVTNRQGPIADHQCETRNSNMTLHLAAGGGQGAMSSSSSIGQLLPRLSSRAITALLVAAVIPMANGHDHDAENIPEGATISGDPIVCLLLD